MAGLSEASLLNDERLVLLYWIDIDGVQAPAGVVRLNRSDCVSLA